MEKVCCRELGGAEGGKTVFGMYYRREFLYRKKKVEEGLHTLTPVTLKTKHQNVLVCVIFASSLCLLEEQSITYFISFP